MEISDWGIDVHADGDYRWIRRAFLLLAGAVFGLAVAAAGAILAVYFWAAMDWAALTIFRQ